MQDFMNFLKKRTSYDDRRGSVMLMGHIIILCGISGIITYFAGYFDVSLMTLIALLVASGISGVLTCLLRKGFNVRLAALTEISYHVFVFMPIFLYNGDNIRNTLPFWYLAILIFLVYILDIRDLITMLILTVYVNFYVYGKIYIWSDVYSIVYNRYVYYFGIMVCILIVGASIVIAIYSSENRYKKTIKVLCNDQKLENENQFKKQELLEKIAISLHSPINYIIGYSDLFMEEESRKDINHRAELIKQASFNLLEFVDDILLYSRLNSRKLTLRETAFNTMDLINQVGSTVKLRAHEKNIKIQAKFNNNIPSALYGDNVNIKQIILRLFFISLSITDNGRIMFDVGYERSENGRQAMLKVDVSDTGMGLTPKEIKDLELVFNSYDSKQNQKVKSIGLKFCICRELAKLMGGNLEIHSIEGIGLKTSVTFMCDVVDATPLVSVENPEEKSVLIIYQDNARLENWKYIMKGFNITPVYVSNVYDFEKALEDYNYKYIFLSFQKYDEVSDIISTYGCQEETYVIGNENNVYGDFGKCRMIRFPVTGINISNVLNDNWKKSDYTAAEGDVTYDGSKAKVLVVDDNRVNLKVAQGILKTYMISADIAESGMDAIKMLETTDYDLVLLDMVMPGLSGAETILRIREMDREAARNVHIVALTANTGANIRDEVISQGYEEYLAKPIKQRYLIAVLTKFLPKSVFKEIKGAKKEKVLPETAFFNAVNEAAKVIDLTALSEKLEEGKHLTFTGESLSRFKEILGAFEVYDIKHIKELTATC